MRTATIIAALVLGALTGCRAPTFCVDCEIPDHIRASSVGTRVPLSELEGKRFRLREAVIAEFHAGQHARAYFVLDLLKTSPYGERQLDSARGRDVIKDLRPIVGPLRSAREGDRSIISIKVPDGHSRPRDPEDEYWQHLVRFERRTGPLNQDTPGLPYSYAARRAFGVSSAEETAMMFSSGEAFLSFVVGRDEVLGFLIARGQLVVRQLPQSPAELRKAVFRLLRMIGQQPVSPTSDEWASEAGPLYDALLGPFSDELERPGLRSLIVSPDGFLANLPFAVLLEPRGGQRRLLLDRLVISYLPSATVYRTLVERPVLEQPPRILAVGNAHYPPEVDQLPFAEREAVMVSELFPDSALLVGDAATEERIATLAPSYNILHFATHGIPLEDVAPGASSLLVTAADGRDGFLNAREVAAMDLSHAYVAALSACQTATVSDSDASGLGSLLTSFLIAGVPSVIGSLWQVNDEATTDVMLRFYARYLDSGAAAAMRAAMQETRAQAELAHPYYWAGFVTYGWDK